MFCLDFSLEGATLVPEMRKPFDILFEGLSVLSSRGDRTPIELFITGVVPAGVQPVQGGRGDGVSPR